MKYAVLLLVVLAGVWLWRSRRREDADERAAAKAKARAAEPPPLLPIVACPVCGLHLPENDAVPGKLALYCSAAHRQQAEP